MKPIEHIRRYARDDGEILGILKISGQAPGQTWTDLERPPQLRAGA
jgi:hypothetical protein